MKLNVKPSLKSPLIICDDPIKPQYEYHIRTRVEHLRGSKTKYKVVAETANAACIKLARRLTLPSLFSGIGKRIISSIKQGKQVTK